MEDCLIVARVKDGDVEAFSLLVEKYHKGLLNFICRLVGDDEAVEDIGQDVFLNAYRSLKEFDERKGVPFSAWLFVLARNRCISQIRKRRRGLQIPIDLIADITADIVSAENLLIEHERQEVVGKLLGELAEPFKQPLIMSLNGSSIKEIAKTFGISLGTVKSRLCRAREQLRILVKNYLGGEEYERI